MKIWSLHSGELLQTIFGHSTAVLLVAFSPASKTLLTPSRAGTVKVWNLQNGQLLKRLAEVHRHESVAVSPDWQILASAPPKALSSFSTSTAANCCKFWKAIQGDDISAIALSPNGKMLVASGLNAASGFSRATVTLWELPGGEVRRTFGRENYVAITPDSKILVSHNSKTIALWNLQTGELLHSLQTGIRITSAAAISPDGKYFALGCFDGSEEAKSREQNSPSPNTTISYSFTLSKIRESTLSCSSWLQLPNCGSNLHANGMALIE